MKKTYQYLLGIGGSLTLISSISAGTYYALAAKNTSSLFLQSPFESYDFEEASQILLKAGIPYTTTNQYIEKMQQIAGENNSQNKIKANEIFDLNSKIMSTISQGMLWDKEPVVEVQNKIKLVKPILMKFTEYYCNEYIIKSDLENDTLNNFQIQSYRSDLYKWSIGENIADYSLLQNYLKSAEDIWKTKQKMSYIYDLFLSKKQTQYINLAKQAQNAIEKNQEEILKLNSDSALILENINNLTSEHLELLKLTNTRIDADFKPIQTSYWVTMGLTGLQVVLLWMPFLASVAGLATLASSVTYTTFKIKGLINSEELVNYIEYFYSGFDDIISKILDISGWILDWHSIFLSTKNIIDVIKNGVGLFETTFKAQVTSLALCTAAAILLTIDFDAQTKHYENLKSLYTSPESDMVKVFNKVIDYKYSEIGQISSKTNSLISKIKNYGMQLQNFQAKEQELISMTSTFEMFEEMNDEVFLDSGFWSKKDIDDWRNKGIEDYTYLLDETSTDQQFEDAYNYEKKLFNSYKTKNDYYWQTFLKNYNNSDKEYLTKFSYSMVQKPLENNKTIMIDQEINWKDYGHNFIK